MNVFRTIAGVSAAFVALGVTGCGNSKTAARAPEAQVAAVQDVAPPLEPNKIVFAMAGIENDFRKCFFRNPRDRGQLHILWQTDTSGIVHRPKIVNSTLGTEAVEQCLLGRVADLRFGPLEHASQGEWVFVFRLATPPEPPPPTKTFKRSAKKSAEPEEEEGISIDANSAGWLDPDRVANVVHAGLPLYARCYRSGLKRQEELAGTIRLQLVIDPSGRVETIRDTGSDLPDLFAVDCVAEGFYALEFPKPERGPVTVSYKMRLN